MSDSVSPENLWVELGIPADYSVKRGLPLQREATEEELIIADFAADDGTQVRLIAPAAEAWQKLRATAASEGVTIFALCGFRSYARQEFLIRQMLAKGRAIDDILRFVAAPGCSEHHTGRAIDVGSPDVIELSEHFEGTTAFAWLQAHAGEYGYRLSYPKANPHGIVYEPWHWYWVG